MKRRRSTIVVLMIVMTIVFGLGLYGERTYSFNKDANDYFNNLPDPFSDQSLMTFKSLK